MGCSESAASAPVQPAPGNAVNETNKPNTDKKASNVSTSVNKNKD